MDLSLGMKYTNMIIVAILALRFLIKLRFPANTPICLILQKIMVIISVSLDPKILLLAIFRPKISDLPCLLHSI